MRKDDQDLEMFAGAGGSGGLEAHAGLWGFSVEEDVQHGCIIVLLHVWMVHRIVNF